MGCEHEVKVWVNEIERVYRQGSMACFWKAGCAEVFGRVEGLEHSRGAGVNETNAEAIIGGARTYVREGNRRI